MKPGLLMVDDDEAIRTQMKWALSQDYDMCFAEDRRGALEAFEASAPAVTLLDLGLPPRPNECDEGLAALSSILAIDSTAKVIVISGQSEKRNALQAVGAGAYDFLCKPVDVEELKLLLRRCIYVVELEREYRELQQGQRSDVFEDMLGTSPQMQSVFAFIRKVAGTNAPVLLLGESGTGKEMAAAAIHRRSVRKDGPFVAINCNAIPENLLESELFGHEKGAFTGAHVQRKGLLETASGGTLFLEDIVFLAREFLQKYANQNGRTKLVFAPDALRAMTRYLWPGNVRELQNRVKRGVIMASGSRLTAKNLELDQDHDVESSSATTLKQAREQVERELIQQALKKNSGRITSAAADLGISRPTLYELMEKLGIAKERTNTNIN